MGMTWKCYSRRPQTNARHGAEEAQNNDSHTTAKHSPSKATSTLSLSLPEQDEWQLSTTRGVQYVMKTHSHAKQKIKALPL